MNFFLESRLAKTPAWALALVIFAVSIISVFLFEYVSIPSYLGIIGMMLLIPVACFVICMIHPKSVRYTPFICNPVAVLGTIFHPLAWTTLSEYLIFVISIVLSVLGAIIGAKIGQRMINQNN
jgi:putative Mn2+ efflux pump MntP